MRIFLLSPGFSVPSTKLEFVMGIEEDGTVYPNGKDPVRSTFEIGAVAFEVTVSVTGKLCPETACVKASAVTESGVVEISSP